MPTSQLRTIVNSALSCIPAHAVAGAAGVAFLVVCLSSPARAQGVAGATGANGIDEVGTGNQTGGAGGAGGAGGPGGSGGISQAGGYGGGGGSGGNGTSTDGNAATGGAGGAGGTGGSGGSAIAATPTIVNSVTVVGGTGGSGGIGGTGGFASTGGTPANGGVGGAGGNSGAGGVGIGGSNLTITNSGSISGGAGAVGGGGGSGGGALAVGGGAATGGGGGVGGSGGNGGAGISGSDLTIINSGTISGGAGGLGGLGGAGAFAGASGTAGVSSAPIVFTGGVNVLELQSGSTINGNVSAFSAADTLRLGGSANASFDASKIGTQYLGFGNLAKSGASTWTLTGTAATAAGWSITGGKINFAASNNFGTGNITLNGGGLQWATGNTTDISGKLNAIGAGGGVFDTNGNNVTLATALSGGGVTKQGAGTLTLSAANSYSGGTTVSAGTLALGNSGALGSGGAAMAGGTTLGFNQNGLAIANTITLTGGAGTKVTVDTDVFAENLNGVISGAGSLVKAGAGTLNLNAANTYTGATNIGGGQLAILTGGSVAASSGINLTAGGADFSIATAGGNQTIKDLTGVNGSFVDLGVFGLTLGSANSTSFAGAILGAGGITKQGSGTLTLTGSSSYADTTDITGGTLKIGAGGSIAFSSLVRLDTAGTSFDISAGGNQTIKDLLGVGGSTVALGANTLTFGTSSSGGFAGIFTGAGGIVKQGAGAVTLSGVSTYTGATTIADGVVAVGAGGSIASSSGVDLTAGGAQFEAFGTQTIKDLSGVNGSTVFVTGGHFLTFGTVNSTTFAGSFAGSGGLVKQGAGFVTLASDNSTFTGAIGLNAGGLVLGNSRALGTGGLTMAGGTTLGFSRNGLTVANAIDLTGTASTDATFDTGAHDATLSGVISGAANIVKTGAGTVNLTGDSSAFTGTTTVDAGTVALGTDAVPAASLGGDVTVGGGTLKGFGTIGGSLVNTGGIVAPGGSIGTLTVGGAFNQGANGTLSIEVSPTRASKLAVGGAASLGGALALVFDPGVYRATTYQLLTAGTVSGKFATVTGTNPTGLKQSILYHSADVTLKLGGGGGGVTPPPPVIVVPTNDTIYTAVTSIAVMSAQAANTVILDRPDAAPAGLQQPVGRGAWMHSFGGFASVNGSASAPGYTSEAGGFLAGYDQPVMEDSYLGLAGGYQHSDTSEHSTSSGLENSARFAVYGGVSAGPSLFTGTVGYAHDWLGTTRRIAGIGKAGESHSGDEATVAGQWSLPVQIGGFGGHGATLTPKAGFQYVHLSQDGFGETGARGFDLSSRDGDTDSFQPFIGVTAGQTFATDGGTEITPDLHLGYGHDVLSNSRKLTLTTVSGDDFLVVGVKPSRDQVTAGVGVTVASGPNFSLYARYDSILYTGNASYQNVSAGLRWQF